MERTGPGGEKSLRLLAVAALGWAGLYLVWRVGWSWRGANPVAGAVLLLGEGYGLWSLATQTWFSWRRPPPVRPPPTLGRQVDVYAWTDGEPISVLRATLTGCRRLNHPHTTYLLDDGRRPECAALAAELGVYYLTRPDRSHARAGALNHALPRTSGELILLLDAGQVPVPDALDAIIGYFDDPRTAVVQTAPGGVGQHPGGQHPGSQHPGADLRGAAVWCGSGALLRRAALTGIGGVAVATSAPELHSSIKLQRLGWRLRYHHETLLPGLPRTQLTARGALAILATPESPVRVRGVTLPQRLGHLASLSACLAGGVRALLVALLAAVLWTGALPLPATWTALALWAPATLLTSATLSHAAPQWTQVRRQRLPLLLLAAALAAGLVARLLHAGAGLPMPELPGIAAWVVPVLALISLCRLLRLPGLRTRKTRATAPVQLVRRAA